MSNKQVNLQLPGSRRAASRSLAPFRHPARNSSVSHSAITHQLAQSTSPTNPLAKATIKQLTYYLGKGNNQAIIRRVMGHRNGWLQSQDPTSAFVNLKWQQDQKGYKYNRLIESGQYRGCVNHFEFHENLSNKEYLFRNLEKYCTKHQIDLWRVVPPTFILNCRDQCCMQALKMFIDYYNKHYPKALKEKRTTTEVEKQIYEERRKLRGYFFNCNLKKVLPKNPPMQNVFINKQQGDYLWIVKPTFLNRGRGIQVFSKLPDFTKFVQQNINGYQQKKLRETEPDVKTKPQLIDYIKRNSQAAKHPLLPREPSPNIHRNLGRPSDDQQIFDGNQFIRVIPNVPAIIKTDCFLIQKYLQRPLLINNHKFDIRMWVLVTHNLKGYVFPQGYIRLSSFQYSAKDTKDSSFVHLTNNAVQKFSTDYGKVADGNQMSFKQLKKVMEQHSLNFDQCKTKIYQHMALSLNATIRKLNQHNRKFSFQIYGYDFMIDQSGHPWLIQVNTNPCLEQSSKLLQKLIPRMLDDAFKLTIDTLFYGSVSTASFEVEGYGKENMWVGLPLVQH